MYICVQVDSELRVDEVAQMIGHSVKSSATEIGEVEVQNITTGCPLYNCMHVF